MTVRAFTRADAPLGSRRTVVLVGALIAAVGGRAGERRGYVRFDRTPVPLQPTFVKRGCSACPPRPSA